MERDEKFGSPKDREKLKGAELCFREGTADSNRNSVRQETLSALFYNITEALNPMSFSFKTLLYICIYNEERTRSAF